MNIFKRLWKVARGLETWEHKPTANGHALAHLMTREVGLTLALEWIVDHSQCALPGSHITATCIRCVASRALNDEYPKPMDRYSKQQQRDIPLRP
jgi:hypothetical protein